MFRLTQQEKSEVVTTCDHLARLRFSPVLPSAFTEHGALMLASVLRTPVAVRVSVEVVRAFVHLRELMNSQADLARKIAELEARYDSQFRVVFAAVRQLMASDEDHPRPRIGFQGRPGEA